MCEQLVEKRVIVDLEKRTKTALIHLQHEQNSVNQQQNFRVKVPAKQLWTIWAGALEVRRGSLSDLDQPVG